VPNESRPVLILFGVIAAVLMAVVSVASAIWQNPVIAIPQAAVAIFAAVGLLRREPAAGYGLGLFVVCSTGAGVYSSYPLAGKPNSFYIAATIVTLLIAAFAFLAGSAIAPLSRLRVWDMVPWIAISAIPIFLALFFSLMMLPSGSMEPTLVTGDTIVVRRCSPNLLKRGDLTVYRDSGRHSVFVKRLVGIEGDRIHLDRKVLYLNDRPRNEGYAIHTTTYFDQYRDNFPAGDLNVPLPQAMRDQLHRQVRGGDFVVPAGSFFLLGDNRDVSLDSRYYGPVPADTIIGKAVAVCFSTDLASDVLTGQRGRHNVLTTARWSRVLLRVF
jgi:signal peptidase I